MSITIRPLTINDADLFTSFLEKMDFSHQPFWKGCYCRYYHSDCPNSQWKDRVGDFNKNEAKEQIEEGLMHGYLAFDNDQPIAWVNVGYWENYPRLKPILQPYADLDTAVAICFMVEITHRGQGVAGLLLDYILKDLVGLGFKTLITIPESVNNLSAVSYRGPLSMYEKRGFVPIHSENGQTIMKKVLI